MLTTGLVLATALALAAPSSAETSPTQSALAAIEAHWQRAFLTGDQAYLGSLLTPDYVSVGTNGAQHTRDMILAAARNYALAHPHADAAPSPDPHMIVRIEGTTGIVTFSVGGQRSVDVFYYADGHWHAWYSQHTNESGGNG